MSDDRRATPRYPTSLAGEMETKTGRVSVAFMRDVSTTGLLVLARHELGIGAPAKLKVKFRETEVNLTGKVVRQEDIDPHVSSLWRYKIAIVVDPSPAFDQLMTELSALATTAPEAT